MAIGMILLVDLMINYFVLIHDFDDVDDEEGDAERHCEMDDHADDFFHIPIPWI